MTKEQRFKRSYYSYDRNRTGKISKTEMLDALLELGKISKSPSAEDEQEGKIPDEVENLFSLMDFANDNK